MRFVCFLICAAILVSAGLCGKAKNKKKQRLLASKETSASISPLVTFDTKECQRYSLYESVGVGVEPQLLGFSLTAQGDDGLPIQRLRSTMSTCHPLKMTIIGNVMNSKISIGELVLYADHMRDRLQLYFNLSDAKSNGSHWLAEKVPGLVRRVTWSGSEEAQATYSIRVGDNATVIDVKLLDGQKIPGTAVKQFKLTMIEDSRVEFYLLGVVLLFAFNVVLWVKHATGNLGFLGLYISNRVNPISMGCLLVKLLFAGWCILQSLIAVEHGWVHNLLVSVCLLIHFGQCGYVLNLLVRFQRNHRKFKTLATIAVLSVCQRLMGFNSFYTLASISLLVVGMQLRMRNIPHACKIWHNLYFIMMLAAVMLTGAFDFRTHVDYVLCVGLAILLVVYEIGFYWRELPLHKHQSVSSGEECPICLEQILVADLYTTECEHIFHRECLIISYTTVSHQCPYCKSAIAKPEDPDDDEASVPAAMAAAAGVVPMIGEGAAMDAAGVAAFGDAAGVGPAGPAG